MDASGDIGQWHYTCAGGCNVLVLFEAFWSKDGTRNTREKGLLIQDNPTLCYVLGIFQKQKVTPTMKRVTDLAEARN